MGELQHIVEGVFFGVMCGLAYQIGGIGYAIAVTVTVLYISIRESE